MDRQRALAALAAEDFSRVVRLTRQKLERDKKPVVLSDKEAEEALRQYYALPILEFPRQQFAVSSKVDDYWHTHVLDTREYRKFCERVYGWFMDHVPLDQDDEVDFRRVRKLYLETRGFLVKHFGHRVSAKAYPVLKGDGRDEIICTFDYCITGVKAPLFEQRAA